MSSEVTEIGTCRYKIVITVPAEKVNERYDQEMKEMAANAVIKGFRRGHVPPAIIERRYAKDVQNGIAAKLFSEYYNEALKEKDLHALTDVEIDENALVAVRGKDFACSAEVEVRPQINIPDYHTLKINPDTEIDEPRVDQEIVQWGKMLAAPQSSDAPSKYGDSLRIAGKVMIATETNPRTFDDWRVRLPEDSAEKVFIFPAIPVDADKLLNLKSGDQKTLSLAINENTAKPEWSGQTATVEFTVSEVQKYDPLSISELCARLQVKDETDLRKTMRDRLESQAKMDDLEKQAKQVMDQLVEQCDFPIPEKYLEKHTERFYQQKALTKAKDETEERLRADAKVEAYKKAKELLIGLTLADREKIQVTEQDLQSYIDVVSRNYQVPPQQVVKQLQDRYFAANVAQTIATGNALSQVVKKIKESAEKAEAKK